MPNSPPGYRRGRVACTQMQGGGTTPRPSTSPVSLSTTGMPGLRMTPSPNTGADPHQVRLLQPLVDDDGTAAVALGHPGLPGVEQVDRLPHERQRVAVGRAELGPAVPQLVDPRLEGGHGRQTKGPRQDERRDPG